MINTSVFARDQIRIVGSSTVFPFAATVAERFGKTPNFKTPVVESTGSGGGLKLFCSGIGVRYPDIVNTSRKIKQSEIKLCQKNGVNDVDEIKIGYDGIVLANSKKSEPMDITVKELYLALAKHVPAEKTGAKMIENPYSLWSDIRSTLPKTPIKVLGPPPTSGTRDAFVDLIMEAGCEQYPAIKEIKKTKKELFKSTCHGIREDGSYVEAGENDSLIIQKLILDPNIFGIFGFSFLDLNLDRLQGAFINGVEPDFETISDGEYPISRSMYFYVKQEHIKTIPGIEEYVKEFTSENAFGEDGYLVEKGLIPLSEKDKEDGYLNKVIKP